MPGGAPPSQHAAAEDANLGQAQAPRAIPAVTAPPLADASTPPIRETYTPKIITSITVHRPLVPDFTDSNTYSHISRRTAALDSKRPAPLKRGAPARTMPPPTRPSATGRASMRQGQRASSTRPQSRLQQPSRPATATATSRSSAASPAASVSSDAAINTAGMKRKERDFESEFSEETNINVVVRCRGRSAREVDENSAVVVGTDGVMGKQVELSMGPNALSNKSYAFDRVFSQAADQSMIFDDVVKPILSEVGLDALRFGDATTC